MDEETSGESREKWPLSFDTFVSVGDRWGSGLEVLIEREPSNSPSGELGLGYTREQSETSRMLPDESPIFKIGLFLAIWEIPKLIAALNEIYKRHYEEAFEEIRGYDESISGQNDDLIEDLRAYRVFADTLSDFAEKLGFFSNEPR